MDGILRKPTYADAKEVANTLIRRSPAREGGVDEIHIVSTEFVVHADAGGRGRRILPLEVEETAEEPGDAPLPAYEFEPTAGGRARLRCCRGTSSRIFTALLQSAASEAAARRRAMKSATDNANELIGTTPGR